MTKDKMKNIKHVAVYGRMNKTEKLAAVKHVAIYLRISDEKKTKGKRVSEEETFENHKQRLTDYCKRNKYTFEIFQEIVSGGKTDMGERPELQKLLARLTDFDAILVNEITRLSRDTFIAGLIQQKMVTFDKLILTPEHSYYLRDSNDALMYGINNVISAHEREVIGKRIKFNKLEMARRGLNASGSVPLGYKRNADTKKLEIDENTVHIIQTAFDLNLKGFGYAKIRDMLTDMGFKTANGKFFTNQTIKDLLKKETYKGFTVYHDYEKITYLENGVEVVKREIKDTIKLPGTHPAIIEPEIFDMLVLQRASRRAADGSKNRERNNTKQPPSIVKDLCYCAKCGRKKKLCFEKAKNRYFIRSCGKEGLLADGSMCHDCGFLANVVEEDVLKKIIDHKEKLEKEIAKLLENDNESIVADCAKMKIQLDKQMKDLENEAERLAELYVEIALKENKVLTAAVEKKINENSAAQNTINVKLEEIKKQIAAPKAAQQIKSRVDVVDVIKKIENETDATKINHFLKQFIFKIHVSRTIPAHIFKLGVNNPKRMAIQPEIKIEFI